MKRTRPHTNEFSPADAARPRPTASSVDICITDTARRRRSKVLTSGAGHDRITDDPTPSRYASLLLRRPTIVACYTAPGGISMEFLQL
jgi:hypothetical protein